MDSGSTSFFGKPSGSDDRASRFKRHFGRAFIVCFVGFFVRHFHWGQNTPSADQAARYTGSAGAAAAIPALAGYPDLTVAYYDIDAVEPEAIRAQLAERHLHADDGDYEAYTQWYYQWHWDAAPNGGCGTSNAEVTLKTKVILPRLTHLDSVRPAVASAWRSYVDALAKHEAGHVRLAEDGRATVGDAVRTSSCADANTAGQHALDRLRQDQADYDRRTDHGRNQGVTFRA